MTPGIAPGIFVCLRGLKARPELNGELGLLIKYNEKKGRGQVLVGEREEVLLKDENLEHLSQDK